MPFYTFTYDHEPSVPKLKVFFLIVLAPDITEAWKQATAAGIQDGADEEGHYWYCDPEGTSSPQIYGCDAWTYRHAIATPEWRTALIWDGAKWTYT